MTELSDLVVIWAVVAVRFFVPFTIPRYPLPGVLASLIADGIDQTIYQQYTDLPLDNYQGYDKALDVYCLTIAYLSTLRTWTNSFAFDLVRVFFYYRLIGVTLFELIQFRPFLMIFPNTFEYFFICCEIARLKWDPKRYSRLFLIGSAALIWVVIKLPQEFIIHIAQVDTTDWINANVFSEDSADSIWYVLALVVLAPLLIFAARWLIRRVPAGDWKVSFSADTHLPPIQEETDLNTQPRRFFSMALVEKMALVWLVGIIFSLVLPDIRATAIEIAIGGTILLVISTAVSQLISRRGVSWAATSVEFIVMLVVNLVLIMMISFLLPSFDGSFNLVNVIFFTLLFTVVITMLDRHRQIRLQRSAAVNRGQLGHHAS